MTNSNSYALLLKRPSLLAEIEQEQATRSLREFVRQAWHVVEPATPFVPGWHIDAIIEHLESVSNGHIPQSVDQRPSAAYEELASLRVLASVGVDSLAGTAVAVQQLRRAVEHPRLGQVQAPDRFRAGIRSAGLMPFRPSPATRTPRGVSRTTAPATGCPRQSVEQLLAKVATGLSATIRTTSRKRNQIRFAKERLSGTTLSCPRA